MKITNVVYYLQSESIINTSYDSYILNIGIPYTREIINRTAIRFIEFHKPVHYMYYNIFLISLIRNDILSW